MGHSVSFNHGEKKKTKLIFTELLLYVRKQGEREREGEGRERK